MGGFVHHVSDDFHKAGDDIKHFNHKAGDAIKHEAEHVTHAVFHTDLAQFLHGASAAEKKFAHDAVVAAHKVGPAFKIAGKDLTWVAGKSW